jgi:hypothetical protein
VRYPHAHNDTYVRSVEAPTHYQAALVKQPVLKNNCHAMRSFNDSLANFSNTLTGLSVADLCFLHINDGASPNDPSLKPY